MGGPEPAAGPRPLPSPDEIERLQRFLTYAASAHLETRTQVLACAPAADGFERIAGMCLWVPARGYSAMLFAPPLSEYPETATATREAIVGALADARADGIKIVQVILEPSGRRCKTVFAAAGLARLANLAYMERRIGSSPPAPAELELPPECRLETYRPETHDLFRTAIEASYEGTLDCPALAGMREMEDVIEGHKGVGVFDPAFWSVLLLDSKPAGCLLLSEIPSRRALELVYLGLAPQARGRGLARRLMKRLLATGVRGRFEISTLAVDAANLPAVRLYRRSGYTRVAERVAMVRRL